MGGFRLIVGNLIARLRMDSADFDQAVQQSAKKLTQTGAAFQRLGTDLTRNVTLPLTALGVGVVKVGSDFESAFAGVRKTVTATEPEFAALRKGFRDLAKEIPISVNELARLGEAAGQLGIPKDEILDFTRVMAELGVSTNLSALEAAEGLARFRNATGRTDADVRKLGDVIVQLGNNFATTEREILEMALRMAGAGAQIGLTDAQILALAASLSSVGIEAEAGGTAFSRVFNEIEKSIATGSKSMELFAAVADKEVPKFVKLFKDDAGEAITLFIEGLLKAREQGESITVILEALGIEGIRVSDSLKRTANAGDLVRESMRQANEQVSKGGALSKEAAERFETFENQLLDLKNELVDIGITLFDAIRPVLVDTVIPAIKSTVEVLAQLAKGFAALPQPVQAGILALAALAAVIGPLSFGVGQLIFAWKNIVSIAPTVVRGIQAITAAKAALTVAAGAGGLSGTLAALGAFLIGPWGLALIAATAAIFYFREELGAAAHSAAQWLGLVQNVADQHRELRGTVTDSYNAIIDRLGVMINIGQKSLTGLRQGTDEYAAALLHNQQRATEATRALAANRDEVMRLKEQYDSGKISLSDYVSRLEGIVNGTKQAAPPTKNLGIDVEALKRAMEAAAKGTKQATDELKQFRDAGQAAINPMGALAVEIANFQKAGFSAQEIGLILSQRMAQASIDTEKMRAAAAALGISLPIAKLDEFAQSALNAGLATNKSAIAMEIAKREQDKLREAFRNGTALQDAAIDSTLRLNGATDMFSASAGAAIVKLGQQEEQTRQTIATIVELNAKGVDASRINAALGVSIDQLVASARVHGIEIDENTAKLLNQIGALQQNQRAGNEWRNIWVGAIGNVKDSFINGVTAMLTEGRKFSVNLKQIFKDLVGSILKLFINNLFGKLLRSFGNFGTNLANQLGLGGSGPGFLGALGLAGPAAGGGGGAAGAAGAAATTGGGGSLGGLGAFFTNPWTIGIGAAIAGFFALRKLLGRGLGDAAKDIQRDFSIAFSTDSLKQFQNQFGVSEETFKKFTKSITLSPAFFQFAQQLGVSNDQLIAAFSNVEVFGRRIDLSAAAAAAAAGDFSLLNEEWVKLFSNSDQLISALGGSLDSLLVANSKASQDTADAADEAADSFDDFGDSATEAVGGIGNSVGKLLDALKAGFDALVVRLDALLDHLGIVVDKSVETVEEVLAAVDESVSAINKMSDASENAASNGLSEKASETSEAVDAVSEFITRLKAAIATKSRSEIDAVLAQAKSSLTGLEFVEFANQIKKLGLLFQIAFPKAGFPSEANDEIAKGKQQTIGPPSSSGNLNVDVAPPVQNFNVTIQVHGTPSDELERVVDTVVEPRLLVLLKQGTGELRAVVTDIVERTHRALSAQTV